MMFDIFQSKTPRLDRSSMPSSNEHTPQIFTSISRESSPSEPSFVVTNTLERHFRSLLHQVFQSQDHLSLHTSDDPTRGLNLFSIIVIIIGYGMSMGHACLICINIFFLSRIVFLQVDLSFLQEPSLFPRNFFSFSLYKNQCIQQNK
jgi:hypothetical protein